MKDSITSVYSFLWRYIWLMKEKQSEEKQNSDMMGGHKDDSTEVSHSLTASFTAFTFFNRNDLSKSS